MLRVPIVIAFLLAVNLPASTIADDSASMVSLGAIALEWSSQYSEQEWSAMALMDGRADLGWSSAENAAFPHWVLFELPEPVKIDAVEVVNADQESDHPGISAKTMVIEGSLRSATDGFELIAELELEPGPRPQRHDITQTDARWVRIALTTNHGHASYTELMDVRLLGKYVDESPAQPDLTGTWETRWDLGSGHAKAYLRQVGGQVTGCYDWAEGRLVGGLDRRIITYSWKQTTGSGLVTMVVNREGTKMNGFWTAGGPAKGWWMATRLSNTPEKECPQDLLAESLAQDGRATVYGINFDLDSDRIREDSRPVLESVARLLLDDPSLRLAIVGHTDSTGTESHNLALSRRRSEAVKIYLQAHWAIAPQRLTSDGRGEQEPVASNETQLGRAANRRVEIVRRPSS